MISLTVGCASGSSPSRPIAVRVSPDREPLPVDWDPCLELADSIPRQLGFDPATRNRVSNLSSDEDGYSGCEFDRIMPSRKGSGQPQERGFLRVVAEGVNVDGLGQIDRSARRITINGREAARVYESYGNGCWIYMALPNGSIGVRLNAIGQTTWVPCDQIEEAARAVEAVLPK
ncbi:DUF3558 family protein [Nocardia sp. IBHARD005]|uniref:DUF3558 family protein n=1 Tax=Nocardia sp. IBHARD005 TaxID=3457765 RepID=UPI004058501A